jgi:hypothetical protein
MKIRYEILFSFVILSSFYSCNKEEKSSVQPSKEVAIDIFQEKEKVRFANPNFDPQEDAEFLQGDMLKTLPSGLLRVKASDDEGDTIKFADEVPVETNETYAQQVYTDGTMKIVNINTTSPEMEFSNQLSVNPIPAEEKAVKTVIENGVATLYNANGGVIQSESVGDLNVKPLLDSAQASINDQSASSQPQNARSRVKSMIQKAQASGMKVISADDQYIVLEKQIGSFNESMTGMKVKSNVERKAVIKMSSDMTKVFSQNIYEGNQLVYSMENEYSTPSDTKRACVTSNSALRNIIPTSGIKCVKQKSLMFRSNGSPYIQNMVETYKTNKISINLKK